MGESVVEQPTCWHCKHGLCMLARDIAVHPSFSVKENVEDWQKTEDDDDDDMVVDEFDHYVAICNSPILRGNVRVPHIIECNLFEAK